MGGFPVPLFIQRVPKTPGRARLLCSARCRLGL